MGRFAKLLFVAATSLLLLCLALLLPMAISVWRGEPSPLRAWLPASAAQALDANQPTATPSPSATERNRLSGKSPELTATTIWVAPTEAAVESEPAPKPKPKPQPAAKPDAKPVTAPQPLQFETKPSEAQPDSTAPSLPTVAATTAFNPAPRRSPKADTAYLNVVQAQLAATAIGDLPQAARGTARLRFTVLADGAVTAVRLAESSGHADLDAAALELPTKTAPFPVPPSGAAMTLEVPLRVQ